MLGRKEPYTDRGIRRVKCAKCKKRKASLQWSTACANENKWVALCVPCDIELNWIVLEWLGDPDISKIMEKYSASLNPSIDPLI